MRTLRIAAAVELVSLLVLLVNLVTAHWPSVSAAIGPTHGCAYLLVIILVFNQSSDTRTRATAAIPAIGGLLVLRQRRATP